MSSIYLVCAGTTSANGVYDLVGGSYTNRANASYNIIQNGSTWELYDSSYSPGLLLYTLNQVSVISDSLWVTSAGASPPPKSYQYYLLGNGDPNTALQTLTVTGAGTSDVNGTYTWNNDINVNYNTAGNFSVKGYENSIYVITLYTGNSTVGNIWQIFHKPNFDMYYSSLIPDTELPCGTYTWDGFSVGDSPAPTATIDTTNICTPIVIGTNTFNIYRNNNQNYILKSGNNFYIRKS